VGKPIRNKDMIVEKEQESKHRKIGLSMGGKKDGFSSEEIALLEGSYNELEVLEDEEISLGDPLLLTRGAHTTPLPLKEQLTHVDWISFTSEETPAILEEFVKILLPKAIIVAQDRGTQGYKFVGSIVNGGVTIGRIAFGTTHGRNLLTFTGKGCAQVKDWAVFVQYFKILTKAKITRIDIALDFFEGEVTHDLVQKAYTEGKFKPLKSPQNPTIAHQQSTSGCGVNQGRTTVIGTKSSSKFIRCYEKGLERFYRVTKDLDEAGRLAFFGNLENLKCSEVDPEAPDTALLDWYRLEVQYGNADRVLDIDTLTDRDQYFSGAYPYCEELIKMPRKTPTRIPDNLETDMEQMFQHIRNQYGPFLGTMLATGMTPEDIIKKCATGKMSQRFIKAGGLEILKPIDPSILTKK